MQRLPTKTHPAVATAALLLVAAALLLGVLVIGYPEHFREYRLYLTEDRPSLDFSFEELSEELTEVELKKMFPKQRFRCYENRPGEHLGERSCFADIDSHNGVPAMSAAFFFSEKHLVNASLNVPWWAHSKMRNTLVSSYGEPTGYQRQPVAGVRLQGWELANGRALFYNRDRPLNPVLWSGVLWSSASFCAKTGCFKSSSDEP